MFEGMLKSLFVMMGIKPEDGAKYVQETVRTIQESDARLKRMEETLLRIEASLPNPKDN